VVTVGGRTDTLRSYRPDIEGLRAVAIGVVLLNHFAIPGIESGDGVDVFFVISGFVITSMLMRRSDSGGRISLSDFFARRARRILPIAITVIVVSMVIERLAYGHAIAASLVRPAQLILLFVLNWDGSTAGILVLTGNPILTYWSLSVEEQFYLAFPVVLLGLTYVWRRWSWRAKAEITIGALSLASFLWAVHSPAHLDPAAYVSTLTRAWQIGVGCILAFEAHRLARLPQWIGATMAWAGLGLVLYTATSKNYTMGYPRWTALVPVAAAALVIGGGTTAVRWGAEGVLALAPVRALGRWSYGMYLWQIPVLLIAQRYWGRPGSLPMWGRVGLLGAVVVLAAASFTLLESPVRQWPMLVERPRLTLGLAAVAIGVGLVVVTLIGR
jgi:peptidoglycan/LPS O-acetylase OafA/YrhL